MTRGFAVLVSSLALAQIVAAAPAAGGKLTVHWLHDKGSNKVAIDVSVGEDGFAPISRQFCGDFSSNHTIDWDGFENNPLVVNLDDTGNGDVGFQGKTYSSKDCGAKYNHETVIVDCTIPYTGTLKPTLPDPWAPSCDLEARGLTHLSPIFERSIAETHLRKRDLQKFQVRSILEGPPPQSATDVEKRQVLPICSFTGCTVLSANPDRKSLTKEIQISDNHDCRDGECTIGQSETKSISVGFEAGLALTQWISGGFNVAIEYSTTSSVECSGGANERVCIWSTIPYEAYNVNNAQCNSCGGDSGRSGDIRVRSPQKSDRSYCTRNENCRTVGQGYFTDEV